MAMFTILKGVNSLFENQFFWIELKMNELFIVECIKWVWVSRRARSALMPIKRIFSVSSNHRVGWSRFPLNFFYAFWFAFPSIPNFLKAWPWLRETGRRKCLNSLLKTFNRDSVIINVPCYCLPLNPILDILQDLFPFLKNVHMGFLHIFYALFYWSHFCNQWLFEKN